MRFAAARATRLIPAALAAAVALGSGPGHAQSGVPPVIATDIPAAEIQAVLDAPSAIADRLITTVDMGEYAVGVGVLRRAPTRPGAPVTAISHAHITEVYYIIKGTGTLLTGGTVTNPRAVPADSDIVKIVVGPSHTAVFDQPAQRRKVSPGDVVVIPPGVYHGFDEVTTGIDYLAVRPDPQHVLPEGYVHPAVQALRGAK